METLKPSKLLREAIADGIIQSRGCYVEASNCMCAASAIYFEATQGQVPWHWQRDVLRQSRVNDLLLAGVPATTPLYLSFIDAEETLFAWLLAKNDEEKKSFQEIAEELEKAGL